MGFKEFSTFYGQSFASRTNYSTNRLGMEEESYKIDVFRRLRAKRDVIQCMKQCEAKAHAFG